jgi:hypothetical protein
MRKMNGTELAWVPSGQEDALGFIGSLEINHACDRFWQKRGVERRTYRQAIELTYARKKKKKAQTLADSVSVKARNGGENTSAGLVLQRLAGSVNLKKEGGVQA